MRVVLVNGSPHKEGCTYTALSEVASVLEKNGVETEMVHIGTQPVRGCVACGKCGTLGRCVFDDDVVNKLAGRLADADGLVVGSPTYYAGPNGALCALLDRLFYSSGGRFKGIPAAAVVSCRRGGSTAALDRLNKYFTITQMPVVSSQYWNMVHGNTPEEVRQDLEGLQVMRVLGHNMAYMMKAMQEAGPVPKWEEEPVRTSFIR